jgi:hypothetical protein
MNNREFFTLVTTELGKDVPEDQIPRLDAFLISLWQVAAESEKRKPVLDDLIGWIKHAYTNKAPNFDPQWMQRTVAFAESAYEEWENTILAHISELHEIFEDVDLADIDDHYGRDNWYNFRVKSYLNGASAGTYGGDTDDEAEIYEIEHFSWQDFADFLEMGKTYN